MATYKVIQDIEAEDKLVGPLSLRQFIYGGIAAVCAYLSFIAVSKNAAFFLGILVPPMLFTGFFAIPWGRDQPTEVWALAKIRFFMKPRRRIWDQSGVKELVTVTAPKRIEKVYTNGLSQVEVRSRLSALANTLDSRGWAVKNVNTNLYDPANAATVIPDSDRLVAASNMPQDVAPVDILPSDDMLDETNNPRAHQLDEMVTAASNNHRQELMKELNQPGQPTPPPTEAHLPPPADYWFLNKPVDMPAPTDGNTVFSDSHVVTPGSEEDIAAAPTAEPTAYEKAVAHKAKTQKQKGLQAPSYQHLKVIQPLGVQAAQSHVAPPPKAHATPPSEPPVTPRLDPDNMRLASNNDLNISALARIASKQDEQPDEVVISLHDHAS